MTAKRELRMALGSARRLSLHNRGEYLRERNAHDQTKSALAGQQHAARIMMASLDRLRKLLEAYGIEEDWDPEWYESYDSWPPPGTLPPPPAHELAVLRYDNRYVFWNPWLDGWVMAPIGVPA